MDGIILAGGKGTRMMPLTQNTPKPLLTVQGKSILERSLLSLRPSVDRILVVVNYLKEQIEAFMQTQAVFEHYVIVDQPQPLGTGHALMCCKPSLETSDFLVINGDDLHSAENIRRLTGVPLGIMTVWRNDLTKWGVVRTDAEGRVQRIHEKPPEGLYPSPSQVNIGAYKLNQSIFDYELSRSERGEYEITDYVTYLAQHHNVYSVPADFWITIGNPDDLAFAQTAALL
jgi:UDP-N-acetylglucosamine diphosphorylase / glucose-1-phosphate thymidylyltransferase / UDP-N-acetylgalactosamine diphosphorylase / glucosamine-1-phosphate N-acetyltransferase / galactosamine-1-phosphate N-acetyltransferase